MKESTQQQVGPEDSALSRGFTLVMRYLLIATSLFHLWTGVMGPLESTLHRSLALSVYLSLLFMLPLYRKPIRSWTQLLRPAPFVIATVAVGVYVWSIYDLLPTKLGNLNELDMVFGIVLIVVVL
ncbi:hypothetical protein N9174_03360, partial [bacterium]|nr:hypothetical protein [bacterium]